MSEIAPNSNNDMELQHKGFGWFAAIVLFVVFAPAVVAWAFAMLAH